MGLSELDDEAEVQALKHAIESYDDQLLFLENNNRNLVAYRFGSEWILREIPESIPEDDFSRLISYSLNMLNLHERSERQSTFGDYYSLRPLIYGGVYWLNKVCRQEFNRHEELGTPDKLSVIVLPWDRRWSLFDLVESVRRGDRIGYFETILGVVLPFTNKTQRNKVENRLNENFDISEIYSWGMGDDFENLHELQTSVKKML